jgi:hypothetical protein
LAKREGCARQGQSVLLLPVRPRTGVCLPELHRNVTVEAPPLSQPYQNTQARRTDLFQILGFLHYIFKNGKYTKYMFMEYINIWHRNIYRNEYNDLTSGFP